ATVILNCLAAQGSCATRAHSDENALASSRANRRSQFRYDSATLTAAIRFASFSGNRMNVPGTFGKCATMLVPTQNDCFISICVSDHGINNGGWPGRNRKSGFKNKPVAFAPTVST